MRAGLIRGLLQEQRTQLPVALPVQTGQQDWCAAAASTAGPQDAVGILTSQMGLCLVGTDWNDAIALINSVDEKVERYNYVSPTMAKAAKRRESAAANKALDHLVPFVAGCVPAGTRLRIDRSRLRNIIEEAAYHILKGSAARSPDRKA